MISMNAIKASEIYDKLRGGDPISDEELVIGINHFTKLSELAFASGDVFRLAAVEARRVADQLDSFKQARRWREDVRCNKTTTGNS